ncbi:hypothetical protein EDB85DRAFT_1892508 [Lactarius pseudohatsudake]|nr:hypothetical protein EDB85DRAFT_1892508 [Lactarius pseudohatsudake]
MSLLWSVVIAVVVVSSEFKLLQLLRLEWLWLTVVVVGVSAVVLVDAGPELLACSALIVATVVIGVSVIAVGVIDLGMSMVDVTGLGVGMVVVVVIVVGDGDSVVAVGVVGVKLESLHLVTVLLPDALAVFGRALEDMCGPGKWW